MHRHEAPRSTDIAVIGMAGRFPGAPDLAQFWQNLLDGRDCATRFTDAELAASGVPEALRRQPGFVPIRAIMEGAEDFDAGLFGFSPAEAARTDPQQRVMLEVAWEALEDAGIDPARTPMIGMYAGADESFSVVSQLATHSNDMAVLIGNNRDYLVTRVAFELGLTGPAMTVQTACSTSLVAVQVACQSLLGWQCDVALAGGVGMNFPQRAGYLYQPGGILSPDGKTRSFDAEGGGTIGGDGCGLVVLKRLADALEAGDTIRAVIRGAALNNDGAGKVGFMAPSLEGQSDVIALALAAAEAPAESVSYVEAHGTATALGDPIEWQALDEVYRAQTALRRFCAIGSVKSNVGHLNSASGIAGLLKVVLCLQHAQLPATLHWQRPNPRIDMEDSCFFVNDRLRAWEAPAQDGGSRWPRRAGVSSFGVGGTNAHAVLEEFVDEPEDAPGDGAAWPILVSARTEEALDRACRRLAERFAGGDSARPAMQDAAWTLLIGRRRFHAHQRLVMAREGGDLSALLIAPTVRCGGGTPAAAMVFPGQGVPLSGAAREWYRLPPFRAALDGCAEILRREGVEILPLLLGEAAQADNACVQPALFALCYATAAVWQGWGVAPGAMLGHSVGEYVAATLAGVFTLEDALRLVAARGHLMGGLPGGAMLGAERSAEEAGRLAAEVCRAQGPGAAEVAVLSSPGRTVLAGTAEGIGALEARLTAEGVPCRRIATSHAFHSSHMEPILSAFRAVLNRIPARPPTCPFLSCLTGTWITAEQATDPGYWVRQLREPVQLGAMIAAAGDCTIWLEVSPGRSLTGTIRQIHPDAEVIAVPHPAAGAERAGGIGAILHAAAQLYRQGVPVGWAQVFGAVTERQPRRVPLPGYAFDRTRFPVQLPGAPAAAAGGGAELRRPVGAWLYTPGWRQERWPGGGALADTRPVLILMPPARRHIALAEAVLAEVRATGVPVIPVRAGSRFSADEAGFTVSPTSEADLRALLAATLALPEPPGTLIHLWGLGAARFSEAMERGLYSLLRLVQGLQDRPVRLRAITTQTMDVMGGEPLEVARTAMLSAIQVIAQELPQIDAQLIDVPPHIADPAETAGWLMGLLERPADDPEARLVAIRGRRLWVPSFQPLPPERAADAGGAAQDRLPWREGGRYLITGGTGQIGLALAAHLAARRKIHLILLSRSGLSAQRDAVRLARIREMEAAGASVELVQADVADVAQMTQALKQAQQGGAINGVIHAAGTGGWAALRTIAQTGPADCPAQWRARLEGLGVLDALLPQEMDFRVVAGSLSGAIGGAGLLAYAAAFRMMAAAASRSRWSVIDWDGWAGDGAEAHGITASEGGDVLERALLSGEPQITVSITDLQPRLRARPAPTRRAGQPRPALDGARVAPADALERLVAGIWEEVLGIEGLGAQDDFFALGGDSLMALQIRGRLREQTGVDLTPEDLLGEPTIAATAARVRAYRARHTSSEHAETVYSGQEYASPSDALPAPDFTGEGPPPPAEISRFYDAVTRQLDRSAVGDYALFLNYGYVALPGPDGATGSGATVQIPAATIDRNSVQLVLELLGPIHPGPGERWLDVGCGRGGTIRTIRTFFAPGELVGLDLSPEAVASCQRRLADAQTRFVCGDAQHLPFEDGEFDGVTNLESSHNYRDGMAFYREVCRVLKPGGHFAYTDLLPVGDWPSRESMLAAAGLTIIDRRDITRNVLRSLAETAARKAKVYRSDGDDMLLADFLGTPESAPFRGMQDGKMSYMLYRLQRP